MLSGFWERGKGRRRGSEFMEFVELREGKARDAIALPRRHSSAGWNPEGSRGIPGFPIRSGMTEK